MMVPTDGIDCLPDAITGSHIFMCFEYGREAHKRCKKIVLAF
jgi:hypothetical protein